MLTSPARQFPDPLDDEVPGEPWRPTGPPVPVITVTRGIDPQARRDPAALDNASPYFATTSEAPRTP